MQEVLNQLFSYVLFPMGIWGLLGVLIIFIAYLVRPRSKKHVLPSMIFFLEEKMKDKRYTWLKYVPRSWLLILHLLMALLLAIALLNPFILANESLTKQEAIHILDTSASMQTADRFDQAKGKLLDSLGRTNTVIVANSQPEVVIQDISFLQMRPLVSQIEVGATPTALTNALTLALALQPEDTVIHIYSDFIDTTQRAEQLNDIIAQLEANNNIVQLHVFDQGQNAVGFVSASITNENISISVSNMLDEQVTTTLSDGRSSQEITLEARDIQVISFPTPGRDVTISLGRQDDFMLDNEFYFSALPDYSVPVLYVTNNVNKFLATALSLIDFVNTDVYEPPGVDNADNYAAFVIEDVDVDKLLPGTITTALQKVEAGGVLVIKMSDAMTRVNVDELFQAQVQEPIISPIFFSDNELTQSLTAGLNERIFPIDIQNATILARSNDGVPVIVTKSYGRGTLVYYGVDDNYNEASLKLSFAYPILFKRVLQDALSFPTIRELNQKSGESFAGVPSLQTPSGTQQPTPLIFDQIGYYQSTNNIAVNLLNVLESNVQSPDVTSSKDITGSSPVPYGIGWIIALVVAFLLLLEYLVLKWRSEV